MLLIAKLLPWRLFSNGRDSGDCICPVLVIWGPRVTLRDLPFWWVSGKAAETQWMLLHGKNCSMCSSAHPYLSSRRGRARDQLPHPLCPCITCLFRVCCQRRAGSLICLVQALPPCSCPSLLRVSQGDLSDASSCPSAASQRKMKEHWGSCCAPSASKLVAEEDLQLPLW